MQRKRLLSAFLAAILLTGTLAGCGGTPQSGGTPTGNASQTPASSGGERPTVTLMGISYTTTPFSAEGADLVIKQIEEYTNTNIEFTWVPVDSYDEKLGVTLMAADNMPMILTVPTLNATVVQAANAGAFVDLSGYISDASKYPNLSRSNENVNKLITVDGKLIGIYRARPIGRNGFGYRKDWADKLGLSEPKTLEDLYNMCKAFSELDPDGNGKRDTYGISLCKTEDPLKIITTWFGAGNDWVERDGQLIPSHLTAEYKEAADWVRKMYEENLIYQDWPVRDSSVWSDTVKNGECGILISVVDDARRVWDYFVQNNIPAVTGEGIASMQLAGALSKNEGDTPVIMATSGMNGFFAITKAAKTEEDVAACLNLLDKMNDNEMLVLADYGMEGRDDGYTLENGKVVMNDTTKKAEQRAQYGANQLIAYIPNLASTNPVLELEEARAKENEVKEANVPYAVFNPAGGFLVNSPTYAANGANLDQILKDARIQYICGQIDEAGLQAAWDNWAKQGGSKVIEEVNQQYKAN